MYGNVSPTSPMKNAAYVRGRKVAGTLVSLIGVSAGDVVSIDPGGIGARFGGNLALPASAYQNWGTTVGTTGYGIRDNAGTIEFKASGGAWAPIAAAAASAGGWTDDGTVVRLDTASDQVGIGIAVPQTNVKLEVLGGTGSLFSDNATDVTGKVTRIGLRHYTIAEEPFYWAVPNTGVSNNTLALGGGTSAGNAASLIAFYTALDNVTVTGSAKVTISGTVMEINQSLADFDFRIGSDTNANHMTVDAGAFSGVGATTFGTSFTDGYYFRVASFVALTATANSSFNWFAAGGNNTVTIPAGTAAAVTSATFVEPNIVATGTVSDAYTVQIINAPTEGTRNGALWVAAGASRFDGNVGIGTPTFGTSATRTLGLFIGTAPSSSPADMVQLFAADISAGNASLGLRTETPVVVDAAIVSTHSLSVTINGTVYRIPLAT